MYGDSLGRKLLSIHLPSNKPLHFRRLVDNLVSTAADPKCFEIVVKIDIGDEAMQQAIAAIQRDVDVNMTVVVSEKFPSYFHTYIALAECLRASDPRYYFCWHVNDEILIETPRWDTVLERYVDFFPDRLFRLKVNPQKMFFNFVDIRETCLYADYPIVPRRWLEASEGWGDCHGADVYHEGISIYLARYGIHRNVPLIDIIVGGDAAGANLAPDKELARAQGTCLAWDDTLSTERQEQMARAARRIQLFIRAHEHGLTQYELRDERVERAIILVGPDEHVYARVFYAVDQVALRFRNFDDIARRSWPFSLWGKPLSYRLAIGTYRTLRSVMDTLAWALKIPVGLALGVRWSALIAASAQSDAAGARMIMTASEVVRSQWRIVRGLLQGRRLIRMRPGRAEEIASIVSGTRQFHETSTVALSARVETASRASHHLLALGAYAEAADISLSVADEPGLLPEPRAPETPASDYVRIAHAQRLDGREQLALHILETAITMTSVDASVAFEIAETHGAAGHVDRALAMYDTAIRLDPEFLDAHWQRGVLLERRGQIDDALEAWRRSDLTRHGAHHSLYLAASMKSPRATNESLLAAHREWARHHAPRPL